MRPSKLIYFLQMTNLVASRSTCNRRKVGCVLVDEHGHILATGYNGAPAGLPHCPAGNECERTRKGLEYCRATHAEQNALLQCPDVNKIHTVYITHSPCVTCTKLLLNTSCQNIFFLSPYDSQDNTAEELWNQSGRGKFERKLVCL